MPSIRSFVRRARRRHAIVFLALVLALAFGLGARHELPGTGEPRAWPNGELTYYDLSGSREAVDAAARRWNGAGVHVSLNRAATPAAADVLFVADRRKLRERCGTRCLGLASSIGRPSEGRVTVLLDPQIAGRPTALNVWVAMHELGHVLGLRHREGTCSLMNARAYDDACTFTGTSERGPLPCGPATGDVKAAVRLYGREPAAPRPCR